MNTSPSGKMKKIIFSPKKSLGARLLMWFFSVSVLPLLIIIAVGLPFTNMTSRQAAINTLTFSYNQKYEQLSNYYRELVQHTVVQSRLDFTLPLIKQITDEGLKSGKPISAFIHTEEYKNIINPVEPVFGKISKEGEISDVLLLNADGLIVYSMNKGNELGRNINEGDLKGSAFGQAFQKAKDEKDVRLSEIDFYETNKRPCFFLINPLSESGTVQGCMAFRISTEAIENILASENKLGTSAVAYILNQDMKILATSDPDDPKYSVFKHISNKEAVNQFALTRSGKAGNNTNGCTVESYQDAYGNDIFGSCIPLSGLAKYGQNYVFVQEIGTNEAKGANVRIIIVMLSLIVVILVLVVISVLYLANRIVKPINQLSVWAGSIAEGDLAYMDIQTAEDEIGQVNSSFRRVVESYREIADVAGSMAVGDFEHKVMEKGPKDRLGKSVNEMLESFKSVIEQATRISNGDYSSEIQPRGEKDSLGKALQVMTRTLRENSEAMTSQDWLKSGMAELSMKLSGDKPNQELTLELITFLVKYLDAQLGLFYMADDKEELTLTATYAFNDRKGNFSSLKPGEGLVGQAALEKEIIVFRDVRENAPALNYGVDEKIPSNFMIAPLVHDRQLAGVVQIGKLEPFTPLQRKFIEQVLDPSSISLITSTSRAKVKQLLEQTQQQAERLQVQQEELRQTNEELEEQTKALRSSEEALQAQQEELRVINEELQERTKALEDQRDDIRTKNTELTRARNEIEEKAKDLEVASKYKSEFLANMSHELRTPLNSIIVLSQLLSENKKQNLTYKQIEYANTINSSGSDLLDLINEILDLSKIEAGRIELHPETIDLKEILNQMELFFKPMVEKKGLSFSLHIDEQVPEKIFVDNQRLQQILKNLLSNALKFTEKGAVRLDVRRPSDLQQPGLSGLKPETSLAFTVSDTGIGIPRDKLKIIFEAFQQADGTTSRRFGGTGLGLTISRSFAQVMGGDIQLLSEEGKGSMFTLLLPVQYEETVKKQDAVKQAPRKVVAAAETKPVQARAMANENPDHDHRDILQKGDKVLLIIEDDPSFARILFDLAEEKGYKCLSARDGESGLYLADLHIPSAIVLDIGLPGIDGWEVMERLHQDAKTRHIPVHFISAMDKSREAMQLGAIGYLTKPVSIEKLRDAFGHIEDVISKPMKKLLVVDDDAVTRKSIVALIGNGDVTTSPVSGGAEAYTLLEKENFDCMILDLGLKDMSGFDLIEKIRANNRLAGLPIIIYTGKDLTREEEDRLQRYADSIIIKGIRSPERLLAETSLFLHRVEANLPKEKQDMIRMLYNQEDVFHDRTILVVDDDSRNVFAITSVLEERGLNVISAGNGREGIDRLKSHPEINLVLMDVMMPEMDGYEAIGIIRKIPKYEQLPIIALTAKAMKEDRDNCIEAGANDYLAKPVDSQKLLSLLRVWLYK
jgi:CheY-like chemotaxis protein/HAMP domain-containing protein